MKVLFFALIPIIISIIYLMIFVLVDIVFDDRRIDATVTFANVNTVIGTILILANVFLGLNAAGKAEKIILLFKPEYVIECGFLNDISFYELLSLCFGITLFISCVLLIANICLKRYIRYKFHTYVKRLVIEYRYSMTIFIVSILIFIVLAAVGG